MARICTLVPTFTMRTEWATMRSNSPRCARPWVSFPFCSHTRTHNTHTHTHTLTHTLLFRLFLFVLPCFSLPFCICLFQLSIFARIGNVYVNFPDSTNPFFPGLNPSTTTTIPMDLVTYSPNYLYSLEDLVLQPVEHDGVDFWWIDWQQGGAQGGCTGEKQNPTVWLNKIRSTDSIRRKDNQRDMILARYGGLGRVCACVCLCP